MRFQTRLSVLNLLAHLGGALLTVLYFHQVDPTAVVGGMPFTRIELVFFVIAFGSIFFTLDRLTARWQASVLGSDALKPEKQEEPTDERMRQKALLLPAFLALVSGGGWLAAGFVWGIVGQALFTEFDLTRSLRLMFGITFVSGTFVTALVFLGAERIMRKELPHLIPDGRVSEQRVPRLLVRTRMIAVLLIVSLLPLAVLAVTALTRADALRTADAATAIIIINNLTTLVIVLGVGGLIISVGLALLVSDSVAQPLREIEKAMSRLKHGELDARCSVVSNDEIGAVAEGFNTMAQGLREREVIRETFGRYVSPQVRDEILAGRATGASTLREVTILFADLRDFTSWVEAKPPLEIVAELNAYFSEMETAIRAHNGLVLQYIGDEIEVVFGAPLDSACHADDALAAAKAMSQRLATLNDTRLRDGKTALRHGIGIHTGTVIAGNIGSSERLTYSLVGDAVNVASRIQSLNKQFGTEVLISEVTREQLNSPVTLELMPAVQVEGRSAQIQVYALGLE